MCQTLDLMLLEKQSTNKQIQNVMSGGDKSDNGHENRAEGQEQQGPRLDSRGVIAPGSWRTRRWPPCEKAEKRVPGRGTCRAKAEK